MGKSKKPFTLNDILFLSVLVKEDMHGQAMLRNLKDNASITVGVGDSIYYSLRKLVRDGLVRVKKKVRQKHTAMNAAHVYQITAAGRKAFNATRDKILVLWEV